MVDMPFFMTDKTWYYFDGHMFVLTDKAPEEAQKSLKEFYKAEAWTLNGGKD